jgi:hypothetical protein
MPYILLQAQYVLIALLLVHLGWGALTSRSWTQWLFFVGVLLFAITFISSQFLGAIIWRSETRHDGSVMRSMVEPYFTIIMWTNLVSVMLILIGLCAELSKRIIGVLHMRRTGERMQ